MVYLRNISKLISIKSFVLLLWISIPLHRIAAQNVHSHNDYEQSVPFWNAYSSGANSIEVDIFLKNGTLYATHEESEIKTDRTIETLYLQPIESILSLKLGKQKSLQLLIDIKSKAEPTLEKLVSVLKKYPNIINDKRITLIISGNRPPVETYSSFPSYITFDHQDLDVIRDKMLWDKVAMISLNFKKTCSWNGLGRLTAEDLYKVKETIDKAHSLGKPFRFWATPDTETAWRALSNLGADHINTDRPFACSQFLNSLVERTYQNRIFSQVYTPTYASDQTDNPIKNIILLIGDGNGLSQISSATLANGGALTLTQLRSIGFLKTASADDFTTDSAAGGTALATGSKTYNRAIGLDTLRQPISNMPEMLSQYGYVSGCITTDRLTGATPASFYAHQKDRSLVSAIASDLPKSQLALFAGGGKEDFNDQRNLSGFTIMESIEAIGSARYDKVGYFFADGDVPGVLEGRNNILAEATKNSINFLQAKDKPFFLMVEGAKIDKYAHKNIVPGVVSEGIDFDRAITEAIKYADDSGNTLVIITADHETSGFSIPQGNLRDGIIEGDFTTFDHTAAMVPIFAYGPHSEKFQGVYENNEVVNRIMEIIQSSY